MTAPMDTHEGLLAKNREDAEQFCRGAFGPFVADVSQYVEIVAKLMDRATDRAFAAPAQAVGNPPDGATHMRHPEYLAAWLFDGTSTMPLWLIEKYHSEPIPEHRKGMYATASVDGEFWRWYEAETFERMFVSLVPSTEPAQASTGLTRPDVLMNVLQAKINDYLELHNRGDLTEHGDHAWLALVNLQRDMEFALKASALPSTNHSAPDKPQTFSVSLSEASDAALRQEVIRRGLI